MSFSTCAMFVSVSPSLKWEKEYYLPHRVEVRIKMGQYMKIIGYYYLYLGEIIIGGK